MPKGFTYSVLQYKHNLVLGERINIGILFHFSIDNTFEFVSGNAHRVKSIYPDFNNSLFNSFFKAIDGNLKSKIDLFNSEYDGVNFESFIHKNIFSKDASGLVFAKPVSVPLFSADKEVIIKEYSKLLLPGINTEKHTTFRHNESYLVRRFSEYIINENSEIEKKLKKNIKVKTKYLSLNFNLGWDLNKKNYLKPISFDLTEPKAIQTKAASYYGFISQLNELSSSNKHQFHFLIAKPQDKSFYSDFENAYDFLYSVKKQNRFIFENEIKDFSDELVLKFSTN
jgi:hypothetical protein